MPNEKKQKAKFRVVRIPSAVTVHVEVKEETAAVFYFEQGSEDEVVLKAAKERWAGPDLLEALRELSAAAKVAYYKNRTPDEAAKFQAVNDAMSKATAALSKAE